MMLKKPGVDVVIFNYNGLADTIVCLKSLLKTKYKNVKIFVIDDASEKNEIGELQKIFNTDKISFIRGLKNKNFAYRANQALRLSENKYVVLLNNDTKVSPDWLNFLVDEIENDPQTAVCQPKIKSLLNKSLFEYAGGSGGYIDRLGYPFTRGRVVFQVEKDKGQYDDTREVFWASGTTMLLNRRIAKKIGGFDERFVAYAEETDFCWRLIKNGYKIKIIPKSVIYHKGASSWKKQSSRKTFLIHRNHLALLIKHLPLSDLLWLIPVRILMDYAALLYYLYYNGPHQSLSVIKAHFSLMFLLPELIKNRSKYYPLKFSPFSVVWEYFVRKNRTFKRLNIKSDLYSSKKSIAYLILNPKVATGNKVIFGHVNKLVEMGYKVRVYSIFENKQTWYKLNAPFKNFINSYKDETPDLLVSTYWPTSYFSFLMKAKKRIYFSQEWEEDFYINPILRILARITYTLPLDKIVISKYLLNRVRKFDRSGRRINNITYATLNSEVFKPRKNLSNKQGFNNNVNILSVISWYNKHKGPDLLVEAVQKLKILHPNYHFTLVSLEEKPYADVFDKFISNPKQAYLSKLYRESDVFLITSRSEGLFLPGLEAMASGCPVITTNCRGILDYAENNKNSIVLNNLKDIWEQDIIEKILENKNKLKRMVNSGYETSMKFDTKYLVRDIEKIYKKRLSQ